MTELRPLDTGFMELEDVDRHVSAGIGAIAILGGPVPARSEFLEAVGRWSRQPRLRQKVRRTPWDLTAPVWVDDPAFDIDRHLRWMALPEPYDETALWELVAHVMEERLDRDHPLWQCVVVERVRPDRWAVIVKAHHSMVDGVSGISLLKRLCDRQPEKTVAAPVRSRGGRGRPGVGRWLRLPYEIPRTLVKTVRAAGPFAVEVVVPAPKSSLNGPIGTRRRYAVGRVSMSAVHSAARFFDVTVNDVALAAVSAGYREILLRRGEDPTNIDLRVLTPVSVRSAEATYIPDNRVSAMLPLLPIDIADPVEQLRRVHQRMSAHKGSGESSAVGSVLTLTRLLPFAPLSWLLRMVTLFPQQGVAGLVTNVPGPKQHLRLLGREIVELTGYVPIAMRLRTGVAVVSYGDRLTFGITGDYDTTADIGVLAETIERTVEVLSTCAAKDTADRG